MPRLLAEEVSNRIYLGEVASRDAAWEVAREACGQEDFRVLKRLGDAGDRGLPSSRFSKHRYVVAALIACGYVSYSEEDNRLYITYDAGRQILRCLEKKYCVSYDELRETQITTMP